MTEEEICRCALCTGAQMRGEICYCIDGEYICPDCLERFARRYFRASLLVL